MTNFQIINSIIEMKGEGFFLIPDSWDDWFEYEISYTLWINKDSESKRIGRVKIAEKNQSSRKTELPRKFQTLAGEFFSIGFNEDYYEKLKQTEFREQILKSLNDIAYNLDLYEHIEEFHVTKVAMMREYSKSMLKGQLHRMALGGARLTDYNFSYERFEKFKKIVEQYGTRMIQQEVADMFRMNIRDVARVTQLANCHNTRKITGENVRKGEAMKPIVIADELQFLDKYPIENFM